MEKLSEIKVGAKISMPLIILEASERKTKTSKTYVALKVSDGATQLVGNYWDWPEGKEIPRRGVVYNIDALVGEWQGTPQLTIANITDAPDANINDFIPSSGVSLEEVFEEACLIADSINDEFLSGLVRASLEVLKYKWLSVPGARTVHHAYKGGTLIHSVSVAKIAASIANNIAIANKDIVVAGALLHDIGKLYTYGFDGAAIEFTDEGQLYEHAFIGAEFIGNYAESFFDGDLSTEDERKLALLRHIILSHHCQLEFGAVITPKCIEAYIVHHADAIDAISEQIKTADTSSQKGAWTDKIWTLNNMPHLKPSYINNVFAEKVSEE